MNRYRNMIGQEKRPAETLTVSRRRKAMIRKFWNQGFSDRTLDLARLYAQEFACRSLGNGGYWGECFQDPEALIDRLLSDIVAETDERVSAHVLLQKDPTVARFVDGAIQCLEIQAMSENPLMRQHFSDLLESIHFASLNPVTLRDDAVYSLERFMFTKVEFEIAAIRENYDGIVAEFEALLIESGQGEV